MEQIDLRRLLGRAGPLVFGVVGSTQPPAVQNIGAGSGIFVAPSFGLTAKHVSRSLFELEPGGDSGFSAQSKTTKHVMNLFQVLEPGNPNSDYAFWHVDQDWNLLYSDLCLMKVSPDDGAAFRMAKQWPRKCFDLSLLPPPVGATVQCLGFPRHAVSGTDERVAIDTPVMFVEGVVTDVYSPFRERGFMNFPCFSFEAPVPIDHGFSGGAVFHGDKLCGIISAAPDFENRAYAATLWPLLRNELLVEQLRLGALGADNWRELLKQIVVRSDERGSYLELQ